MAAAWMAHCGVEARIVDKRNAKIFCGQADGLQCRSLEIFDSLGFADRAWKEASHMIEVWNTAEVWTAATISSCLLYQRPDLHVGA